MSGRTERIVAAIAIAVSALVRIRVALVFPFLRSYDGFGHFSYVWFFSETSRVPMATSGWSYFHPPLYYALMSIPWRLLEGLDSVVRVQAGVIAFGLLGMTHAWVLWKILGERFAGSAHLRLLAPFLVLFLPLGLYSSAFIGNEGLNAVLCSFSLLALLRALRRETVASFALLGLVLGAAMLTKFTSLALVAGAMATFALRALVRRDPRFAARSILVTLSVLTAVSGWYYLRNVQTYGTPFKMSREEFLVQRVEHIQSGGRRGLLEYLLFDPFVLDDPSWPRGIPLFGLRGTPPVYEHDAVKESVWTGLYVTTWFTGERGVLLPSTAASPTSRRVGQVLLALGILPTLLMAIGFACAARDLLREWDDTLAAMLTTFTALLGIFLVGTVTVPLHAAVKATYLLPGTVMFGFWFAYGLAWAQRRLPSLRRVAIAVCVAIAVVGSGVYSYVLPGFRDYISAGLAVGMWENLYGMVYYAGGQREKARERFERASGRSWHLGFENLATMALQDGDPERALALFERALELAPGQSFGIPEDRARTDRVTRAEYETGLTAALRALGRAADARAAAEEAVRLDPTIPEAHYNLAALEIEDALASRDSARRGRGLDGAAERLRRALELDPGYADALALLAVVAAAQGDCVAATTTLARAEAGCPPLCRAYPVETGVGDLHAAAIRRRWQIPLGPAHFSYDGAVGACIGARADSAGG